MKVLGIGEVVIDNIHVLDQSLIEGQKIQSLSTQYSIGGPVTVALILLSRLGVQCTFMTSFGSDEYGMYIANKLHGEQINVIQHPGGQTKLNIVLVNQENGSRSIIRSSAVHTPISGLTKENLRGYDLIICDRHNCEAYKEIIKNKEKRTKVIIDPSTEVSEHTLHMISTSDIPVVPIESLVKLNPRESFHQNLISLHRIANSNIIITAGELGSLLYDGTNLYISPSYSITPVDCLSAGDIYRGGLAYGILNGWSIESSLDFGNAVAALQCLKVGSDTAIPTSDEIRQFRSSAKNRTVHLQDITNQYEQLKKELCQTI